MGEAAKEGNNAIEHPAVKGIYLIGPKKAEIKER